METLLSPVVLFFAMGALAAFARSDLAIPEPLSKSLSLYLMCAIGLKGGILVADNGFSVDLFLAAGAGQLVRFLFFAVLENLMSLMLLPSQPITAR
jgi:hypothetical protein